MSLAADLHTLDLADLLEWLSRRAKTGTLHLRRRATHKRLFVVEGTLHSAWSNDPRETLGQFLIRDRLITEEALFKVLLRQEQEKRLLGAMLVSDGVLTPAQLSRVLKENARESIYDLFLWPEGRVDFQDGERPKEVNIDLGLSLETVVREGARRRQEWLRIRGRLPSREMTFKVVSDLDALEDLGERLVFDLAARGKTMAEIGLETRRSDFATAACLHGLCVKGMLAPDLIADETAVVDPVLAIQELLKVAAQRLAQRRYDAAFEAYENALVLDGLNQEAKKGLVAVADARQRDRLARRVPLEGIPAVVMPSMALNRERFDAQEGFVLSRVNGEWDVRSILKLCPMPEEDALQIFLRLVERKVITLR
jgi:hypothetical protein